MMHLKYISFYNRQFFFLTIFLFACSGAEKERESTETKTTPERKNG